MRFQTGTMCLAIATSIVGGFAFTAAAQERSSHLANGIKIGEVTSNSAVVWTRLTREATWNSQGPEFVGKAKPEVPDDAAVDGFKFAAPGMPGRIRVRYGRAGDAAPKPETPWIEVTAATDFAHSFRLEKLLPATEYEVYVETADLDATASPHQRLDGGFRTAPTAEADVAVRFCVMTCQAFKDTDHADGFEIYRSMLTPRPDFIVPDGDIVYLDSEAPRARTVALARYHWNRMYGFPRLIEFHRQIPGYWTKDDHDTYDNDSFPQEKTSKLMSPLSFEEGLRINREQTPAVDKPYRTFRWGKRLQVWVTEGREFRSPNNVPDGPAKTIWGDEQKRWFKETVAASDADWKVLVSPTPLVGPDRGNKHDNHANDNFRHEGDELREWIRDHGRGRLFVVCGDRHWQYHSVDPRTGVNEFSCGPASNEHASGSPGEDPAYHKFHRVKGGYLGVDIAPPAEGKQSSITFRHYDVAGRVVYEKRFE